ncbi:phosphatidylinositol mannoside acyltransferase [Microlunatus ginsengisoli]|uniref:Phosphatidylinositol mannoside acyltransferase n=1 Tax=Microlunatus ginsengisoli TaxID=363863 RepID=A0ABP6ZD43_9ACTN
MPDRDRLRAFGVRQLYRAGWRIGSWLPRGLVAAIIGRAARRTLRADGWHVRNLRRNLALVSGALAGDDLVEAALVSHFRNVYEQLALPGAADRLVAGVTTTGEAALRAAHADRGAVVALPHSGNWDLAGAWACRSGFPVTTVAERLGEAEFAAFTEFRTRLGMEVFAHGDPAAVAGLVDAVGRGRVVCLLADRDLARDGVAVRFAGQPVTMPVGPALIAQRSGAALFPTVSQFTPEGMVLRIGPEVGVEPGPDGLAAATQRVADVFAERIAERPEDWHLLQPFFAEPLTGPEAAR